MQEHFEASKDAQINSDPSIFGEDDSNSDESILTEIPRDQVSNEMSMSIKTKPSSGS